MNCCRFWTYNKKVPTSHCAISGSKLLQERRTAMMNFSLRGSLQLDLNPQAWTNIKIMHRLSIPKQKNLGTTVHYYFLVRFSVYLWCSAVTGPWITFSSRQPNRPALLLNFRVLTWPLLCYFDVTFGWRSLCQLQLLRHLNTKRRGIKSSLISFVFWKNLPGKFSRHRCSVTPSS